MGCFFMNICRLPSEVRRNRSFWLLSIETWHRQCIKPNFSLWRGLYLLASPMRESETRKFVARLRLSLQSVVTSFSFATLMGAVMRTLEVESTHEKYHQTKSGGQTGQQRHRGTEVKTTRVCCSSRGEQTVVCWHALYFRSPFTHFGGLF